MNPRYADQNKTITHQRVDECRLDFYDEDGNDMNPWLVVVLVLVGLFVVLYIVALIKRPGSRYQDKPEEQNQMQGKMVRFVENSEEKENADGMRGHLEAIGPSSHRSGVYES